MSTESQISQTHFNSKLVIEEVKILRLLVYKMRKEMLAIHAAGPNPERVIAAKEAAMRLGVSTSTLWLICEEDEGFPIKLRITERRCGWKNSELEAYIESKKVLIR